jgi:septum site-determining protein MinC
MSTIRGRGRTLEIGIDRALVAAGAEMRDWFGDRPEFYRGSNAVANLGPLEPTPGELAEFRDTLAEFGVTLDGINGIESLAPIVAELGLAYLGSAPAGEVQALPRQRREREVRLSDSAKSLVADFAGARADMARRRVTPAESPAAPISAPAAAAAAVAAAARPSAPLGVATLYHRGTLRGGQALHNLGNIVVIGDVNPGAELVASGDIAVFGALRGVAHAGAQGDRGARVVALELAPTQLRIATVISSAADGKPHGPEHASIVDDRIVVVPLDAADLRREQQA